MHRLHLVLGFAWMILWLAGCRVPPPNVVPPGTMVKGTVTMDGKPLPSGELHFGNIDVPASVLKVENGAFAGEAPIGENKVEVFIWVDGPPSEKYPDTPTRVNRSPERYFGPNTILKAKVEAGAANEFKFDLTSR